MNTLATPNLNDAILEVKDRIATLTLNRHDVRNALTGTGLIEDIVTTCEWVNQADHVSVLIITGAGSSFSAGGNIKDMAERGGDFAGDVAEVATRYRRGIQRIPLAMEQVEILPITDETPKIQHITLEKIEETEKESGGR